MKRIQFLCVIAVGAMLVQTVQGRVFWTEQFANYSDGRLGDSGTGGGGTIPGWNTAQDQITVTNAKGSLVGTDLGLVTSFGARAAIAAVNANGTNVYNGAYNKFVESGTFRPDRATNIYTSFLYRFNVGTDVSTVGVPISAMNRQNSGFASSGTFSWWLVAKRVGNAIQLGVTRAAATSTNYATTTVTAGQTFLVVVRQQIMTNSTSDTIDLWINPAPASLGVAEENVPPVSATTSDGTDDTSNTGPGRFWVISPGASADIDEIRVADTWAEATPPAGQCSTAVVTADPTNVTQCAEISAAFKVTADGTSPMYQWQQSKDGGSTWANIGGATLAAYTTPNLSLATDNGNQYRAIVSVACDGSSATSAPAIVTLTAPVVTPAGMIMNDTFLDTDAIGFDDRSNPPLTSTNSLWFTSVTDDLTAYGQGGNMLGTPAAGSSRLWLGYFTETNQPPVHLEVGRSLKVTLPFIPNSFGSFTNNASLRFGLFDYADGGTRVIEDGNNVSGSTGNGIGVRGYMLSLDWGTTFSANSPVQLLVRSSLGDVNLMGTTGVYTSLGSGPAGGGYIGAPAFQAGTEYTLVFTVARKAVNSVDVSVTITGGGTNWSHTVTESAYAYHRFDAFAIRPNSLETSADSFTFPEFKVEVVQGSVSVPAFSLTGVQSLGAGSVKLTWDSVSGATYHVLSRDSLSTGNWTTNGTVVATGSSTSYTNSSIPGTVTERYYRVLAPSYMP